jgi:thiamine biosynthesis lipoprotein
VRSASFEALGTTATLVVARDDQLDGARESLRRELKRIDRACSSFRPDSELAYVNANAGRRVTVSTLFASALHVALDAARSTNGLVTPTLGNALRAAGYDRTFALVRARGRWTVRACDPQPEAWRRIQLDPVRREVLVPEGTRLDLGATAKALAADSAASRLAAEIGSGVLVSLGGDIAVAGTAPAGGWSVRIADDHDQPLEGPGPVVGISGGGLATSSVAVRRWPTDLGAAHHILDPRTALPATSPWRTVTVAAASCADANVAATAAIVQGHSAVAWLAARGLHARLVDDAGAVSRVGGWPAEEAGR